MLGIDNRSSDAIILGCAPKLALSWALVFVGPSPYSPGRSAAGACEGSSIALSTMRRVVRGPVGSLLGKGPGVRRPRKTPTVSLSKRARTGGKTYAPTYTSLGPRTVTLYCATSRICELMRPGVNPRECGVTIVRMWCELANMVRISANLREYGFALECECANVVRMCVNLCDPRPNRQRVLGLDSPW